MGADTGHDALHHRGGNPFQGDPCHVGALQHALTPQLVGIWRKALFGYGGGTFNP
jgi:hypothetical protein